MSLLSKVISNLFGGVSQQPPELRDASQAAMQVNAISSPSYGLRKRPGTTSVAKMGAETLEPKVHFINRDKHEQYAVMVSNGNIQVFDTQTGGEITVSKPDGMQYLQGIDPQTDLRLVSVADHTFILNTKRHVQLQAELNGADDALKGTISFPIPTLQLPVKDPTDNSQTPPSSGSGGGYGFPTYGGGGDGGTGTGTGTGLPNDPTKPKDPSNPNKTDLAVSLEGLSLPDGKVGVPYSTVDFKGLFKIVGDSGTAGTTSWSASGVPAGLSFTNGVLSGTPTSKGAFSFTVTATYKGLSASKSYSVTVTEVAKIDQNASTGGWGNTQEGQQASQTGTAGVTNKAYAWQVFTLNGGLPDYLGDGDLMARLKAQGLNSNSILATYRPSLTVTVQGDPSATDLRRFFPSGTTTYGGAGNTGSLGLLANILISGLQSENYNLVTNYTNGYYLNESFPQLVVKDSVTDDGSHMLATDIFKTANATMFYGVADGGSTVAMNLFTTIAFDAVYILPVSGIWSTDPNNPDMRILTPMSDVFELPVRISVTGIRPIASPSPDTELDMLCGRIEDYYMDGNLLYNPLTYQMSTPIDGFTRELNRWVVVEKGSGQVSTTPTSRLTISAQCGVTYGSAGGTSLTYGGRKVLFNPPLAYKILPKAGLTQAALGPYVGLYKLYGTTQLTSVDSTDLAGVI